MVSGERIQTDVVVIGDGLIGLSTALELGRAGVRCIVLGAERAGAASRAAAGLLVPTIGDLAAEARPFFAASMEAYPDFVGRLRNVDPGLRIIQGVVERTADGDRVHPHDGAIDNVRLTDAVAGALRAHASAKVVADPAIELRASRDQVVVETASGRQIEGARVIVAAGAWAPQIRGLPRPLPVTPLKGQMLALGAAPLDRAIMGDEVYLVPRGQETLVGATVEHAGFDAEVRDEAIAFLHANALALCPELRGAEITRRWAGTRPATPDMLPILGRDPDAPAVLYACGHWKNGILLAPATAALMADLVLHGESSLAWAPFSISRFA
jgi:glycine oxidase